MQQSSLVIFCEECGLANDPASDRCTGCGQPLVQKDDTQRLVSASPVIIAPPPVLAITPGSLMQPVSQSSGEQLFGLPCDFRPGSIFAERYEIGEEIGRGGFSTVYHAIDHGFGYQYREVAIKRIQLNQLSPRQIIDATETFNREVEMLARLRSVSGIPSYYDHLTDAENWYLITQYIAGETLEEYIQKAPGGHLSEQEVIAIGMTLAALVQRLHNIEPPIIFRDLKPSNIMITPDQTFFLIDFGIARMFTRGKAKDTTPLGSPGYAPPEQYGKAQTDQRSDIYSLGATMQTLLTGYDPLELRSGRPSRNPQPPSRALRKLLAEMLSADASLRPATMARVIRSLEYALHRPLLLFWAGLIYGVMLGIGWLIEFLLFPLLSWDASLKNVLFYPFWMAAAFIEKRFRKRFDLPKQTPSGWRRFWLAGFALGAGFWTLLTFILQHF